MQALHSVLNMAKHALTEFEMYLRLQMCQDSEYGRVLDVQGLHRVLNTPQYDWIYINKQGSKFVSSVYKLMGTY